MLKRLLLDIRYLEIDRNPEVFWVRNLALWLSQGVGGVPPPGLGIPKECFQQIEKMGTIVGHTEL
jgi:hypothetical protein